MSGLRHLLAGLLAASAAAAALAGGVAALAASRSPARATLGEFSCVTALEPVARAISVTATMYPLAGRPANFALLPVLMRRGSTGRSGYVPVTGGQLGHWLHPQDPTLGQHPGDIWIVRLPVLDLAAPADYRLRIRFRWLDAQGRTLAGRTETTPPCHQPELRPDLAVSQLGAPTAGYRETYAVRVRNLGATPAGRFIVRLVQGATIIDKTVAGLSAHAALILRFQAGRCDPASPPRVTVDPGALVDDPVRANNSVVISC